VWYNLFVGFYIFGLEIRYYGVILAVGILAAFFLAKFFCKKRKYRMEIPYQLFFVCVPFSMVGARLYYIIFHDISMNFFDFRSGGLAIYGGVIFGALALFLYSRVKKCSFFAVADIIAPGLILAQAIGRWGNFFNGEAYGFAVDFNFFPLTVEIDGQSYLAAFFYESVLNFLGFCLLLRLFLHRKKHGTVTAWYLIWYGLVRAAVEPLRIDSLLIYPGSDFVLNRISFLVSIAIAAAGVVILYLNKKGKILQNDERLY
jgi:phosphatidylglycerol:prolipoprotein diacylglycerol transferase